MDYVDAATTGILSPHVLPIMDLQKMLSYIEETLSPTYQYHWMIPYTFTNTYAPTFCSPTNNSYSL